MYTNSKVQSLQEDFAALGIKVAQKPLNEGDESQTEKNGDKRKLDEAVKLVKKRRGSKARKAKKKAKMYYRKHRASIKRKAKKFKKSASGKRFMKKYKKALTRFQGKVGKGKRIQVSDTDVKLANMIIEGYEGILRVNEIADTAQKIEDGVVKMYESIDGLMDDIGVIVEQDDDDDDVCPDCGKPWDECECEDEGEDDEYEEDVNTSVKNIDCLGEELDNAMTDFDSIVERIETELNGIEGCLDDLNEEKADEHLKTASKLFREAYEQYEEIVS